MEKHDHPALLPLIKTHQHHTPKSYLDASLGSMETFFSLFGFHLVAKSNKFMSWAVFLVMGVGVPFVLAKFYYGLESSSGVKRIEAVDVGVPLTQSFLGFGCLVLVSYNLRKYGVKRLLFVDDEFEELERLHGDYVNKIKDFYLVTFLWLLPCILTKGIHVVFQVYYVYHMSWLSSTLILLATLLSWTYLTIVYLSSCTLFSLVCNLQVVHFDDYPKLLQTRSDTSFLLEEHMRICFHLSKISHRFRLHLLFVFFLSIIAQFVTLLRTTKFHGVVNFVNAGDFVVSSAVQVIGIVICLNAATRISQRSQKVAAFGSRWHALASCKEKNHFDDSQTTPSGGDTMNDSTNPCLNNRCKTSSSYHQREALVLYLQDHKVCITIYGWAVDRGLITTIVCIEISLVTFIFSGTL